MRKRGVIHFLPDHCDEVKMMIAQGLDENAIMQVFDISPTKMKKWKKLYPDFAEAVAKGQTLADAKVLESLYKRACGYDYVLPKVSQTTGKVALEHNHLPGSVAAQKLWLTNRRRDEWSERKVVDVNVELGERLSRALTRVEHDGNVIEGELVDRGSDDVETEPESAS